LGYFWAGVDLSCKKIPNSAELKATLVLILMADIDALLVIIDVLLVIINNLLVMFNF